MTNSLTVQNDSNSLTVMTKLAEVFVGSGRFPTEQNVYQAMVKIQAGKELGIAPLQSMTNIHIVQGRITLGSGLVSSLIKSHPIYDYKVKELSNNGCELEFFENGESVGFSSFTQDDAKSAGLLNKDVWKKYPRNMYFSRALTNGAKWFCSAVFGGPVYTPEELENSNYETDMIVDEDDLANMQWGDFGSKVRNEINSDITDEVIKDELKDAGFSWIASSKRDMFDHLFGKFINIVEGDVEVAVGIE